MDLIVKSQGYENKIKELETLVTEMTQLIKNPSYTSINAGSLMNKNNSLVFNLKSEIKKLKDELKRKDEEIRLTKLNTKYNVGKEIQFQMEGYKNECQRLKEIIDQYNNGELILAENILETPKSPENDLLFENRISDLQKSLKITKEELDRQKRIYEKDSNKYKSQIEVLKSENKSLLLRSNEKNPEDLKNIPQPIVINDFEKMENAINMKELRQIKNEVKN